MDTKVTQTHTKPEDVLVVLVWKCCGFRLLSSKVKMTKRERCKTIEGKRRWWLLYLAIEGLVICLRFSSWWKLWEMKCMGPWHHSSDIASLLFSSFSFATIGHRQSFSIPKRKKAKRSHDRRFSFRPPEWNLLPFSMSHWMRLTILFLRLWSKTRGIIISFLSDGSVRLRTKSFGQI